MYLKRLELQGFKSFPEKIKLDFNKGITAVVGPNGSGKSNISDAVRWVLGEQSVKNLRGSKMEDVIFSGTQNRKPLGFAEVSLIIDNSDNKLNVEFLEVKVTRRVFRSGESDYLINGSSCRLKDIHELFMDTGIGKEGYSIIGQGRIDEILSTKSEDRRLLFEEAVGIVKFKNRKVESENKLEKEKQNLIRINDIINELENQIEPLKIQAEKAKKYLALSDRLKLVQINIFLNEVKRAEQEIDKIENNIKHTEILLDEEFDKKNKLESDLKEFKNKLNDIEVKFKNLNIVLSDKRSECEQKENDVKLAEKNIEHINTNIERIKNNILKNNKFILKKNEDTVLIDTSVTAKKIELKTKKDSLELKQKEFEKLNYKVSESEELIDKYNTDIIEKMNVLADVKSKYQKSSLFYDQIKSRNLQVIKDIDFSKSQINDKNIHLEALKEIKNKNNKTKKQIENKINDLNYKKDNILDEINNLKKLQNDLNKRFTSANSKYKILTELQNDYEGYYDSVKTILKQKSNGNKNFNGICGAVGELINVDRDYEIAIEIALGATVQNIVTKNELDAKKAIEYLKNNKKGRATFLPLTAIKGKDAGNLKENILNENCVIGIARDLIQYDVKYENIISYLLGKIVVIDNIDAAIEFSKKYKYNYKVVTVEGELINPGGALSGGSINKKSAGIFSRSREISILEKDIEEINIKLKKINEDTIKKENEFNNLINQIDSIKINLQDIVINNNDTDNKINNTENIINELTGKQSNLNIELNQLNTQIKDSQDILDNYKNEIDSLEQNIDNMHKLLDNCQNNIMSDKNYKELQNKEITDLKISINEIEINLNTFKSDIERIKIEILNSEKENIDLNKELEICHQSEGVETDKINLLENEIILLKQQFENIQNQINELNNDKIKVSSEIENIDSSLKDSSDTILNLKNELTRFELKKESIEKKNNELYDLMWDNYEITYVGATKYEKLNLTVSQLSLEEKSLKSEIKLLGNVNVNASEDYDNVKNRYEFLKTQKIDIINAENNLRNIISELEILMKEQFREQFKLIDKNFSKVFHEMFGGGTAHLKLSDENDILNSGIEIVVQPPGKNLQSMSLLSGGERALTAMSLLFAILIMKPSPFCILDEIEAALDDSNVKRYADFLKKFSNETQFILITHRKGTMEAADILYGVTMQEQGVSKLISVKFTEAEVI